MAFELILLGALIFIFIVSFCGLLQKIRQTYDRERLLAERIARRRAQARNNRRRSDGSLSEVYVNPAYIGNNAGVFPTAPPPYSQYYSEAPPKYEEIIKVHENVGEVTENRQTTTELARETGPPPYTINLANN